MSDTDFMRQMAGYGLTTATILYRMPDHRDILQSYIWQNYDLAPRFPELHAFLDFWRARAGRAAAFGDGRACPPHPASPRSSMFRAC